MHSQEFNKDRLDSMILHLYQNDIETRPMFPVITNHYHLSNIKGAFPNSQILQDSVIMLPSYPMLLDKEISYICNCIKMYLEG